MLHTRTALLVASTAISGCRPTTVPNPVLQPAVTAAGNDTSTRSTSLWILTPSPQPHTYHSISQTIVKEFANSTNRENTVEINTTFTVSLDQSRAPLIISGHIDTVRFRRQNQPSSENNPFALPLLFEGELTPTALKISVRNSQVTDGVCSPSISSILGDLRAVITAYPLRLTPGFTWRDSTLITTCTTDAIPTTRKIIRSFRVVGERTFITTRALLLQRLDSTYISGDGSQNNHQIHLEGSGTGTANIYIDQLAAVTLGAELSEKLEITITNFGQLRHFTQEVTQRLEATN